MIVAHGSAPDEVTQYLFWKKEVPPTFGGYEAAALASIVARAVPDQYRGLIYLSGCDTAVQYDFRPGTSFIEKFERRAAAAQPQSQPEIRGNMGAASTFDASKETIEIPGSWIEKHPNLKQICEPKDAQVVRRLEHRCRGVVLAQRRDLPLRLLCAPVSRRSARG